MNAIDITYTVWHAPTQSYRSYAETIAKDDSRAIRAMESLLIDPVDGGWEFESSRGMVCIDRIAHAHLPTADQVTMGGRFSCE